MQPYDPESLPLQSLDWSRLLPSLGGVHRELAYFDALLRNMPKADLLLSPLEMQEATLSSRIEGTQATLDEVLRFQADGQAEGEKRDDIQEIINYRKAVEAAVKNLATDSTSQDLKLLPLLGRLLREAHKILLSGVRSKTRTPGEFRTGLVHIGSIGKSVAQARYVPPELQRIEQLFANLENYMHFEEKDVLVQAAIIHAQFEIIHPFWDGNGRIGRLLIPLFLYAKEVISAPCLYLSEYIEAHRDEYYDYLNNIFEHRHWEEWIMFFLTAVSKQSQRNIEKAQRIIDLREDTLLKVQGAAHSQYTPQITDFISANPWFTGIQFRDGAKIPYPSIARLLFHLEQAGIIYKEREGRGRRSSLFLFPRLLEVIS